MGDMVFPFSSYASMLVYKPMTIDCVPNVWFDTGVDNLSASRPGKNVIDMAWHIYDFP